MTRAILTACLCLPLAACTSSGACATDTQLGPTVAEKLCFDAVPPKICKDVEGGYTQSKFYKGKLCKAVGYPSHCNRQSQAADVAKQLQDHYAQFCH